jgi:hypothetical protein
MGFFKDLISSPASLATLGMAGRNERHQQNAANAANSNMLSGNQQNLNYYRSQGAQRINDLYGASGQNIGADATDYSNRVKGLLDQNTAKSQQYLQNASRSMASLNAKAGLRGVDTTAMNAQNRMNAKYGADVINEEARKNALDLYGKNVGARQEGVNQMQMGYEGLALASQNPAVAQQKPGLLGSLFAGIF